MKLDVDVFQTDTIRIALQLLAAVAGNTLTALDGQIQAQMQPAQASDTAAPAQPPADPPPAPQG